MAAEPPVAAPLAGSARGWGGREQAEGGSRAEAPSRRRSCFWSSKGAKRAPLYPVWMRRILVRRAADRGTYRMHPVPPTTCPWVSRRRERHEPALTGVSGAPVGLSRQPHGPWLGEVPCPRQGLQWRNGWMAQSLAPVPPTAGGHLAGGSLGGVRAEKGLESG